MIILKTDVGVNNGNLFGHCIRVALGQTTLDNERLIGAVSLDVRCGHNVFYARTFGVLKKATRVLHNDLERLVCRFDGNYQELHGCIVHDRMLGILE